MRAAISGGCRSSTRIDRLVRAPALLVRGRERDREHGFVELIRVEAGDVCVGYAPGTVAHLLEQRRELRRVSDRLAHPLPERVSLRGAGGGQIGGCRRGANTRARAAYRGGRAL